VSRFLWLAADAPSSLDPAGRGADVIETEMWIQFAVGAFTFLLVIGLLVFVVARRMQRDPSEAHVANEPGAQRWLVLGGIVFPVVALTGLFGISVHDLVTLADPPGQEKVIVEVRGQRWWWNFDYPVEGVRSPNHLVIPVGESVRVRLRARDVIHSFWVPQLSRKIDLLPTEWTTIWMKAERPGRYRGLCAEFCGAQHARMHFVVDAVTPVQYDAWRANAKKNAPEPKTASERRGRAIFESHSCAYCHTIRGTKAAGWVGPDLTHLASRPSLAAGTLPNTRGNLGGWISDPQHVKPGALMPPGRLSGPELQALLDYLTTLR